MWKPYSFHPVDLGREFFDIIIKTNVNNNPNKIGRPIKKPRKINPTLSANIKPQDATKIANTNKYNIITPPSYVNSNNVQKFFQKKQFLC